MTCFGYRFSFISVLVAISWLLVLLMREGGSKEGVRNWDVRRMGKCQEMFTVEKGGRLWVHDSPYVELSEQLPPLFINSTSSRSQSSSLVYSGTRLTLLNGSIPYLPCKVYQYNAVDVGSCSGKRSVKGRKTWVAFFGDSNGRQKLHSFLDFLPPDYEFDFYLGETRVSRENFLSAVAHHEHRPMTFDILGRSRKTKKTDDKEATGPQNHELEKNDVFTAFNVSKTEKYTSSTFQLHEFDVPLDSWELRVTLVWAPHASYASPVSPLHRVPVTKLDEWDRLEVIPDVVVLGFGTWMMLQREDMDELVPFTETEYLVRPLVAPLKRLASRTTVLWWHQSRYRWFTIENGGGIAWEDVLKYNQMRDSIPFMDNWIWVASLRKTGMWHWDSTVPFNLANIRECLYLKESGLENTKIYEGRWWNCFDIHHSSYETNVVEIQMLFNLLCNQYVAENEHYCCSSG